MAKKRPQFELQPQESVPNISAEFQNVVNEALLFMLLEKDLLTLAQYEKCIAGLKKLHAPP